MKSIIFSFLFLFVLSFSYSQEAAYRIEVELKNHNSDELYMGQFYGKKPFLMDTTSRQSSGKFIFEDTEMVSTGIHYIVIPPNNKFIQFLITDKESFIKIAADVNELPASVDISGSEDNTIFMEYLDFYSKKQQRLEQLKTEKENSPDKTDKLERQIKEIGEEIAAYKKEVNKNHPNTLTAAILMADIEPEFPEFEGTEEEILQKKYDFRLQHYFDNVDLSDSRLLRTPVVNNKVDYYIHKLTLQRPDSVISSIDRVLEMAKPNKENFQYLIVQFLNEYGRTNTLRFEEIFVHLSDNYVQKGLTPFIDEDSKNEILRKAYRLKPIFVGKQAPKITVYDREENPIELYNIDADYTVLVFWRPGCGTCQKSMPKIIKFREDYKDKGVQIFTVCTDMGDKSNKCWEYVDQKGMADHFINTYDPRNKSRFHQKYDIRTTPKIMILDRNKEILVNRIGAEQLGEFLDRFIEKEKQEGSE